MCFCCLFVVSFFADTRLLKIVLIGKLLKKSQVFTKMKVPSYYGVLVSGAASKIFPSILKTRMKLNKLKHQSLFLDVAEK